MIDHIVGIHNPVEPLTRKGTTAKLKARYASDLDTRHRKHNIASYVVRVPDKNMVAVGFDRTSSEQINAFVDALHWRRSIGQTDGLLTFCFYTGGTNDRLVQDAVSTLFYSLAPQEQKLVSVLQDGEPADLSVPDFNGKNAKWAQDLNSREGDSLPLLAEEFQAKAAEAKVSSFRWYRTVTQRMFSGRVEGLQVCTIPLGGQQITFKIGSIGTKGNEGRARLRFAQLAGASERVYGRDELEAAINLLRDLAKDRGTGDLLKVEREHHMESRILRENLAVGIKGLGQVEALIPKNGIPFQFPARWSPADSPRFIDIVGRIGDIPWLLELKESGQGQGYRHAIVQAVLYRHFIRSAQDLHFWFKSKPYEPDPCKCEAAVVFPELRGPSASTLREAHEAVARMFGVQVVELPEK